MMHRQTIPIFPCNAQSILMSTLFRRTSYFEAVPLVNLQSSLVSIFTFVTLSFHHKEHRNSLIPHVAQNTRTPRNCLLFPAGSASRSVVIGGIALHLGDFAETGGVGLCGVLLVECIH
jgi:hypothetical protein